MQPQSRIGIVSYHWPYGMKELAGIRTYKLQKDCQWVIHKTYNGAHIEIVHRVILSKTEGVAKNIFLPKITTPGPVTCEEILDNDTRTINKCP